MKWVFSLLLWSAAAFAQTEGASPPPFLFAPRVRELRQTDIGWQQLYADGRRVDWRRSGTRWISAAERYELSDDGVWIGPDKARCKVSAEDPNLWNCATPDGKPYRIAYESRLRVNRDGAIYTAMPHGRLWATPTP